MYLFDSLEQVYAQCNSGQRHQITAQEIINRRTFIDGSWQTIELTSKCEDEFISAILDVLGGWTKNQPLMARVLRNSRPQHWGLSRILFEKYGDSPLRISYCAGQDYPYELKQIRQYLNR
jgi:hypothetical protein